MNSLLESLVELVSFYKDELGAYQHNNTSESNLNGKYVF